MMRVPISFQNKVSMMTNVRSHFTLSTIMTANRKSHGTNHSKKWCFTYTSIVSQLGSGVQTSIYG